MSQRVGELLSSLEPDALESVRVNATGDAWETFLPMDRIVYDTDGDGIVDTAERIEIIVRVRSSDYPSGLTKGTVVYIGGATGNRPYVLKADASDESTSSKTLGIVVADIAGNADGTVAINGTLHDLALPTTTYTDGDSLWLSETAGEFVVNPPPAEPAHSVFIGWVARAHPTQGRIILHIQNGYELNELHGVKITGIPANGEVLTYQTSTGLWENKPASGGGGVEILGEEFTDVAVTNTTGNAVSVIVPASKLATNGDSLRVQAVMSVSRSAGTATIAPEFGANAIGSFTSATSTLSVEVLIIRTSSTAFRAMLTGGTALTTSYTEVTGLASGWFDSARTFEFVLTSNNAGCTITSRFGKVEFLPSA